MYCICFSLLKLWSTLCCQKCSINSLLSLVVVVLKIQNKHNVVHFTNISGFPFPFPANIKWCIFSQYILCTYICTYHFPHTQGPLTLSNSKVPVISIFGINIAFCSATHTGTSHSQQQTLLFRGAAHFNIWRKHCILQCHTHRDLSLSATLLLKGAAHFNIWCKHCILQCHTQGPLTLSNRHCYSEVPLISTFGVNIAFCSAMCILAALLIHCVQNGWTQSYGSLMAVASLKIFCKLQTAPNPALFSGTHCKSSQWRMESG